MDTSLTSTKRAGTPLSIGVEKQAIQVVRTFLLACGMLAPLLYIAMNIFIPMQYPGYDMSSQVVSELSAIDAPTRPVWVLWGTVYTVLTIAFGLGIWLKAGKNLPLKIVGIQFILQGMVGFFWPPMHQRPALVVGEGSMTDTLHIVFSVVTLLFMILMMGFGAAALGKGFRNYCLVTLAVFILFGVLTGLEAPRLEKGLPTPMIGIWERINIGAFMLWMMVLSVILLRKGNKVKAPVTQKTV